jgi:alkylresorcinol/alkylpyrone synthase
MSGQGAAVRLGGLATAVPPHVIPQSLARTVAAGLFREGLPDIERLLPLFDNSGIEQRHSAMPPAWHLAGHGFAERNRAFIAAAEALLAEAALAALSRAGTAAEEIDAVVCVCSSGIATPSLEARVAERIGLRHDVARLPVFGLGCGGGVLGLARSAALARAEPGTKVLLLVVELCTLTLRLHDRSKANLVAFALFGDGAAAAVLGTGCEGPVLGRAGEHRWPNSFDVMGWQVEDDGLGVLFSVKVPEIARQRMRGAATGFLERHGLTLGHIDRFICHPGGAKVVQALEHALGLAAGALDDARDALRRYGNMSAASVLFVLEQALAEPGWRRGLMTALGPGFSAGFMLVERPEA